MAEKTVANTGNPMPSQVGQSKERTRGMERFVPPPVDIYEGPEGLVLLADLPGVAPEELKVRLEDNPDHPGKPKTSGGWRSHLQRIRAGKLFSAI